MKVTSHTTLVIGKAGKAEEIPPGTPVDIDDDEAKDLIARGLAVRVAKAEPKPEKEKTPDKEMQGGKSPAEAQGGKAA